MSLGERSSSAEKSDLLIDLKDVYGALCQREGASQVGLLVRTCLPKQGTQRTWFNPGSGRLPWSRSWQPTQGQALAWIPWTEGPCGPAGGYNWATWHAHRCKRVGPELPPLWKKPWSHGGGTGLQCPEALTQCSFNYSYSSSITYTQTQCNSHIFRAQWCTLFTNIYLKYASLCKYAEPFFYLHI